MIRFLADSCCSTAMTETSFPPTRPYLWITFGVVGAVFVLGLALGFLIARKRAKGAA